MTSPLDLVDFAVWKFFQVHLVIILHRERAVQKKCRARILCFSGGEANNGVYVFDKSIEVHTPLHSLMLTVICIREVVRDHIREPSICKLFTNNLNGSLAGLTDDVERFYSFYCLKCLKFFVLGSALRRGVKAD